MSYCTAPYCKYRHTHNILSHKCNRCGKYGHILGEEFLIPIDEQCTIEGCQHKETHTKTGHQCRACDKYGHSFHTCNVFDLEKMIKLYEELSPENTDPIYLIRYNGMGTFLCFRKKGNKMEYFNIDQYGFDEDRFPELLEFIKGYKPLRKCDLITTD
jgi:hypothetical protein